MKQKIQELFEEDRNGEVKAEEGREGEGLWQQRQKLCRKHCMVMKRGEMAISCG